MSRLKQFLQRRSENLQKEKKVSEQHSKLTDDEFWAILNEFNRRIRDLPKGKTPERLLEELLEPLPVHKIEQFAEKYKKLNA